MGGYNGSGPRFAAFNVANPSSPSTLCTKDFPDSGYARVWSLAVRGTKAVLGISGNSDRISFVDISNISAPVERGSMTTGVPVAIRISPDGNYAYFIDYVNPSVLRVANIINLASPSVVGNIPLDVSEAMNMDLRGSELFVGTLRGVYVFDITNPASPVLTRSYSMSAVYGICAPTEPANQSGNVYVADGDGGIVAFREQDIQSPDVFITTPWSLPVYTNATSNVGGVVRMMMSA